MAFDKLDAFLAKLKTAKDDDELRRMFSEFSLPHDTNVPRDPFSREYRDYQFALYERLAGKTYTTANELMGFDVEECAIRPFPYCHGSSETVGNQLMAIGFLIKTMRLPKGASILEFGPGWGNTTIALAKMGYHVTAVDVGPDFINLISKRAAMERLEVELVHGDFSYVHTAQRCYDAVLFFECFHHCSDHLGLIAAFDRVVKPGGIVCFAAEPVSDEFPIPWGLRMDGEALWAIRQNGWFELGFNDKYFFKALARYGWVGFSFQGSDSPLSSVIIVKRKQEPERIYSFAKAELHHLVGITKNGAVETSGGDAGYVTFGPYGQLAPGRWNAELLFDGNFDHSGTLFIDVVDRHGEVQIAGEQRCELTSADLARCNVTFANQNQLDCFEVRARCEKGTRVRITGVRLRPVDPLPHPPKQTMKRRLLRLARKIESQINTRRRRQLATAAVNEVVPSSAHAPAKIEQRERRSDPVTHLNELANPMKWKNPDWLAVHNELETYATAKHVFNENIEMAHRKGWEWTQAVFGLQRLGAIRRDARALGVGSGNEPLLFYLADRLAEVIGTDLYGNEQWIREGGKEADAALLVDASRFCARTFDKTRLTLRAMDGTRLEFPDNSFDFVWSLSSIEHFGGHSASAKSMCEMGRVVKPGGIVVIATEYIISRDTKDHPEFFTHANFVRYILQASPDLELVEPMDYALPPREWLDDPIRLGTADVHRVRHHVVLQEGAVLFTSAIVFFRKRVDGS